MLFHKSLKDEEYQCVHKDKIKNSVDFDVIKGV